MPGPSPVNRALTVWRAAEDRVLGDESAVVAQSRDVRQDRSIEARRQTSGDVATVVTGGDQDRVGRAGALTSGVDRRRDRARRAAHRRGRPTS